MGQNVFIKLREVLAKTCLPRATFLKLSDILSFPLTVVLSRPLPQPWNLHTETFNPFTAWMSFENDQ